MPKPDKATWFDAVVVGAGPVGATAANLLGREGLRTLIVDTAPEPYPMPRALGMDHEALRLLQGSGVAAAIESGLEPYRASEYRSATGALLQRIVPQPPPFPLAWPPYVTFIQPELEAALRDAIARCPAVELRTGTTASLLADGAEGARLLLRDGATGAEQQVACHYVIACDGASSSLRRQLGIGSDDLHFDEPWLVVDVVVRDGSNLPEVNVQFCDPSRPTTYIRGPGQVRRWEFMLLPGESPAEMVQDKAIQRLLAPWLTREDGRIWRAATYRFHALISQRWRVGSVFLAGDAAHQMPPFMAQGLNQGMRDVGNLCWKLADVVQGRAKPALLDSYEAERKPAAEAVATMSKKLGQVICERDPAAAAARDTAMREAVAAGRGELVRQSMLPPIKDGFIMRGPDGHPVPGAGLLAPQPRINGAQGSERLDDVLAFRYLLVVATSRGLDLETIKQAGELGAVVASLDGVSRAGVQILQEQPPLFAEWLRQHNADAMLVRPDRVVFGSAAGADATATLLSAALSIASR